MADEIQTKNITTVDTITSIDDSDKVFVNDNGSFKQISVSNLMKQAPSGVTEETDPTVSEWAKQPTKPSYTADEVGALPVGTKIPTKTSDLTNDSGYLTQIPKEYVTETELGQKGYVIEDDIPEKLPSPGILTFTGAVNDTYDGSTNKTINIPTGGGEGGTSDYNALANKPKLNGVEIAGNKTSTDYKIVSSEQGIENNGKFLGIGADGNVTPVDKPTYTADEVGARPDTWTPSAEDVGALPNDTEIPSKTSDLENDSGFITNSDIPEKLPNPQKIIFTGAVSAEYDGSSQQTINIPTGGGSGSYTLPIMSSTQLGGGKAIAKTDEDVPVAVDPETGQLFVPTYPENTGGGGGTVDSEQIEQAVNSYLEKNPVSGMTAEQEQQLSQNTTDITDLKSALSDLYEMNPSEGSQIYDILEYGAERWDGKRISGTTIVNAGSNYYGYILDRSKIEKEVRLIVSNNPASAVIINEQNPEIGNTISVSETLTATSVGSGGYQYTITPGEGYLLFYRQGEFSYAFICEKINLSKDLDIPGGTYISGSLDFATKGNYRGFKLPDVPSDTIVFLKVSDDVNLISVQIQDISGEAAEGITTQVNTNSTVICWISNGKPAMLRYEKSNNTSYQTLYETMKISIVCIDQGGIQEFKKKNAVGNAIMCGIYANNKTDSLFLSLFADYLECDVRKSSDGTYVLNHNVTYAGYTISDTELSTLQEQGIWTLNELYRFVSECDLGLALDAKVEITDSDIRKAHAITRGKNVIVAGNQFSEPPFYFTMYHDKRTSNFPEEYKERVIYDAGNTIGEPELRNGLNSKYTTDDLSVLSELVNGLDIIEYDVKAAKKTLTALYGCIF